MCGSCLAARRSELVSSICSMLPYGTGICCYAFIQSGIDKSTEWSMIPACPSLTCFFFFNRSSWMFVYVLFHVNVRTDSVVFRECVV